MSSKMAAVTRCLYIFIFFMVLLASSSSKPLNISRTLSVGKENDTKRKKPLLEDHIKGLKLERDGHVNKEYHHEAFLGKMVEDGVLLFDNVDGSRRLIEIFHKVDKNEDHKVSKEEMKDWIHEKIKEHIQEAKDNNHRMFKIVDRNGDGVVTWDEFRLKFKEDNETKKKDSTELDDAGTPEEVMSEYYAKFRRGDMNLDDKLDESEFLYFQHPEHNPQSTKDLVEDMIENFDRNQDKVLTKSEFIRLPPGEVDTQEEANMDNEYVKEREEEFAAMDENGDGIVNSEELTKYLAPTHEQRAINEANYLVRVADRDYDGFLSEQEMIMNYQLFTGSSMANYAAYLHDEF